MAKTAICLKMGYSRYILFAVDHFYFVTWTFQSKEADTTYIFDGISKIKFSRSSNKIIEIGEYETKYDTFYPYNKNI